MDMATKTLKLKKYASGYYKACWVDDLGRKHQRSFGRVKRLAENKFATFRVLWKSDPTVRTPNDEGPVTVSVALGRHQAHAQAYYVDANGKPTGEATNLRLASRELDELFGAQPVASFTPRDLKRVQEAMVDADLCVNEVNKRIRKIRQIFKWFVSEEIVEPIVWQGLQAVSPVKAGRSTVRATAPVGPAPEAHVWDAVAKMPKTVKAMVKLQMYTGMRPGEVCDMRQIDLDTNGEVWLYRPRTHKNAHRGKSREILIGPKAQEEIKPFLKRNVMAELFSPREAMSQRHSARATHRKVPWQPKPGARKLGEKYTTMTYRQAIHYACKAAGLEEDCWWSPNQLRHNFATMARKTSGVETARAALGHAKLETTEIYAEIDEARVRELVLKIG